MEVGGERELGIIQIGQVQRGDGAVITADSALGNLKSEGGSFALIRFSA